MENEEYYHCTMKRAMITRFNYSELVDKLNEALSTENASVDRIISRIDHSYDSYSV